MESFQQLSYHERVKIYNWLCEGKTIREMALMLGRSVSTISREMRRNMEVPIIIFPNL